jgi:hypothetical protein
MENAKGLIHDHLDGGVERETNAESKRSKE